MMRSSPDVSFVIAAYNAADTIRRAVNSALAQEGVDVEVIVIDDCSSDDTCAVVAGFGDPRVRLVRLARNGGPGAARNAGIDVARGRWIAILDADDSVSPQRLARMTKLASDASSEIVVDNIDVANLDGRIERMFPDAELARHPTMSLAAFIGSNVLFRSTYNFGYMKPVFERRFLITHGLRFEEGIRIGEDYILLASALALGGRCAVDPSAGYCYHIRKGSISRVLELSHVEAMVAADRDFLAKYEISGQAMAMQRRRDRSLREAHAFLRLVAQLKSRSWVGATQVAFSNPGALRHLKMPVAARLRRYLDPVARAARPTAAERSATGEGPQASKG
ncbi:glycosyltransferase family 2 protein [Ensifer sp.]|jgi:succinoglycan biosynthesis protein ExoO|uniref:glycosyltransferase family 2 protein n=1 Tax=Ensifer sp. TaxID=1872086 RepID=UPI002E0DF22B|nr:glycosyltransferase family 2 protein [Ensifer sp.]